MAAAALKRPPQGTTAPLQGEVPLAGVRRCFKCGNAVLICGDWEVSCLLCGWARLYRDPPALSADPPVPAERRAPPPRPVPPAPPPTSSRRRGGQPGPRQRWPSRSVAYLTLVAGVSPCTVLERVEQEGTT